MTGAFGWPTAALSLYKRSNPGIGSTVVRELATVGNVNVPDNLLYSSDHEWIERVERGVRIGITDYAQDALGDVVFVQLPERGATVAAHESFSEVESTKSVSDIYSPVNGTVTEVNNELVDAPQRINEDPYGTGWICVIEMSDSSEYDNLLDAESYNRLISA